MAIHKSSPYELAIHGGGPPSFANKVHAISPNVGDGRLFGALAERMFTSGDAPGRLVKDFEHLAGRWLGVRNVIGFSSMSAALRTIERGLRLEDRILVPAFGSEMFPFDLSPYPVDCDRGCYGISPTALSGFIRDDVNAIFGINPLGRTCRMDEIEAIAAEWNVPVFFCGHQSLGCCHKEKRLGGFGRAEVYELGRDQLIHALDSAIVVTDDDLIAHRLRIARGRRVDPGDPAMGDAAAAMGIANLQAAESFIEANRLTYELYRELLLNVPGIDIVRHDHGSTYQSIAVEVDRTKAGLTRDSLHDVLAAEHVMTIKPFHHSHTSGSPVAAELTANLLRLPSGPAATQEVIRTVCKLIELSIIRSLESPDPVRKAA